MNLSSVDILILEKINRRPLWSHSLRAVKPRVQALISAGLARRICPKGGIRANMVAITLAGEEALVKAKRPAA